MKKTVITIIILNIIFAVGVLFYITKDDRVVYENVKEVSSSLAIMVYDEATSNYIEQNVVPKGDKYIVNEFKTYCTSNGEITNYNNIEGTITYSLNNADHCYVYFDIYEDALNLEAGSNLSAAIKNYGDVNTMSSDNSWGIIKENGYRYEGAEPYNYICFGSNDSYCPEDNKYRIIGVFEVQYDDNNDGNVDTTGYLTKIQKNTTYGSYAFDSPQTNSYYPESEIYSVMNDTFYSSLDSKYQSQIVNVKWNIGAVENSYTTLTADDFYVQERGQATTSSANEYEKLFKIGLMYPSDYGYGVLSNNCIRETPLYTYTHECRDNNWIHLSKTYEWTITARNISPPRVFATNSDGLIGANNTILNYSWNVRPVFFLKSDVVVKSGTGTYTNPYRIS